MLIWAIIATISAITLLMILLNFKRQVKNACRCIRFNNKHTSNRRLIEYSFKSINELNSEINNILDKTAKNQIETQKNEAALKETLVNLSHDIRTPLTSLKGYFQLMQKCENQQDRQRYTKIINNRITSLQDMLEELFTYAKLNDNSYTFECERLDMKQCCFEIFFSFYEDFKQKGIEPEISISEENIFVNANSGALSRSIQNVVKNALVHGQKKIIVSLTNDKDFAVLKISNQTDHPEEIDIYKVFDKFYKADSARSRTSTGLGLSIAKDLTEKMGGQISSELSEDMFSVIIKIPVCL